MGRSILGRIFGIRREPPGPTVDEAERKAEKVLAEIRKKRKKEEEARRERSIRAIAEGGLLPRNLLKVVYVYPEYYMGNWGTRYPLDIVTYDEEFPSAVRYMIPDDLGIREPFDLYPAVMRYTDL